MNSVQLVGRLTANPEVRKTGVNRDTSVATFTIAVDRRFVNRKDPNAQTADFIRCIAFKQSADFIDKYFKKGNRIGINGRIQTGNYTNKDGQKVYTTDVIVEAVEFVESRKSADDAVGQSNSDDGFMNIPDGLDGDTLPFN